MSPVGQPRFLRSMWRAAVIGIALALIAAPAYGAKPIRTVHGPSEPSVVPAGLGCAFDVLWTPSADARITVTQFDDGRTVTNTNASPTLTNLSTGASFVHEARYHLTETYDPESNEIVLVVDGSFVVVFFPGDVGPHGIVSEPGLTLRTTGRLELTFDADTFTVTEFSFAGTFTDVCALLSE